MVTWQNCRILITGGASFIGSHLTDALVERGAKVRIVDDLPAANWRISSNISPRALWSSSRPTCGSRG
jgi:nucleoside-diphosphate-sugar epimerase